MSEFNPSGSGSLGPAVPPENSFDPRSHWLAPASQRASRRGPTRLAMAATVVAFIGMVGVLLLGSNTASAGNSTVLSATAPIAAVPQSASALGGGSVQASTVAAGVDPAVVDI